MLNSSGLSYTYEGSNPISFPDLDIKTGQHTLIIGKSGCGKTTLLHLLAGLRKPESGAIHIGDKNITQLSSSEIDKFRGRNIGMIFQVPHFIRSLNVIENIILAQSLAGLKQDRLKCLGLLERLGLKAMSKKKTSELSVGEQQRVAIVRALINEPSIIFADEPTSALDDENTDHVIDLLQSQAEQQGATLVVVTHDQRLKDKFSNQIAL